MILFAHKCPHIILKYNFIQEEIMFAHYTCLVTFHIPMSENMM